MCDKIKLNKTTGDSCSRLRLLLITERNMALQLAEQLYFMAGICM